MADGIKKGDKIIINDNLREELIRLGFKNDPAFIKRFKGAKCTVIDVYLDDDSGEYFVAVDLGCEIPVSACIKLNNLDTTKKSRPKTKPHIEQFEQIANACGGILSDIAASFKVARGTVYAWCEEDSEFRRALEDSRERFVDLAESNLRKLVAGVPAIETDEDGNKRFAGWVERPSETAIIFTLKTRGKKRGYVERSEVEADVNMKGSVDIKEWVKDRLKKKK